MATRETWRFEFVTGSASGMTSAEFCEREGLNARALVTLAGERATQTNAGHQLQVPLALQLPLQQSVLVAQVAFVGAQHVLPMQFAVVAQQSELVRQVLPFGEQSAAQRPLFGN